MLSTVDADGLQRRAPAAKIGIPYEEPDAWRAHLYAGLAGGYGYSNESEFVGAGIIGYGISNKLYHLGVEADISTNPGRVLDRLRDEGYGTERVQEESDNWLVSARVKGGINLMPRLAAFATGGLAWDEEDTGPVYGGGLTYDIGNSWEGRGEILRYNLEEDSTVVRFGLGYKFKWN